MPLSAVDEHVRPDRTVRECHLYFGARDTELHPGTIILLGGDNNGENTTFQTAFSKARDTTIHGGFYGINATETALEYAISVAAADAHQQLVLRREAIDLRRQKLADMKYHQRVDTHTNVLRAHKRIDLSVPSSKVNKPGYVQSPEEEYPSSNGRYMYRPRDSASGYMDIQAMTDGKNRDIKMLNWPNEYSGDNQTGRPGASCDSQSLVQGATLYQSQDYSAALPRGQARDSARIAEFPVMKNRRSVTNAKACVPVGYINPTTRFKRYRRGV